MSNTPGGTSTSGEIITTLYESTQLDNGEPNTPGPSNTLSNSIPCVSNYPFVMGNQLTKKQRDQVTNLLIKYENVFAFSMKELGRCKTMQFSIDLTDETPVYRRRHRLSKHEWELVDERCKELHEAGLIQPSRSDFAAAIVMPAIYFWQIAQRNGMKLDTDLALGFASHHGKIGTMECLVDDGNAEAFLGPLMRAAERGYMEVSRQ
jgi:hypothetical protein